MTMFQAIFFIGLAVCGGAAFTASGEPLRERITVATAIVGVGLCVYGVIMSVVDLVW